jgi:hypothetical protein
LPWLRPQDAANMMRGLATHHCSITAKLLNEESSPHSDLGTKCVGAQHRCAPAWQNFSLTTLILIGPPTRSMN